MTTMTLELPSSPMVTVSKIRLDFRRLHAIRTEKEYDAAMAAIHSLFDRGDKRTAEEEDLLEFLSILVEAYEEANVTMPLDSSPQEIVAFLLDQRGMTRTDLQGPLGGKGRVSEFFNNKRPLSKSQMLALKKLFHIPLDLLAF